MWCKSCVSSSAAEETMASPEYLHVSRTDGCVVCLVRGRLQRVEGLQRIGYGTECAV